MDMTGIEDRESWTAVEHLVRLFRLRSNDEPALVSAVCQEAVRLIDLHVRLPRHHVAMLEHFAERDRTTVSGVLARELDDVASAHADELSGVIAGFADALAWPDADAAQLPC